MSVTSRTSPETRSLTLPWRALLALLLPVPLVPGWASEATAGYRWPDATIKADAAEVTEGESVTLTVTLSRNAHPDGVTVNVLLLTNGDFFNAADKGIRTVSIPGNGESGTLTVATTGDQMDDMSGLLGAIVMGGHRYFPATPDWGGKAVVAILDDDPTEVVLAATDNAADEDGGGLARRPARAVRRV